MPAQDNSLKMGLMNAGISAGDADDIVIRIAAAINAATGAGTGTGSFTTLASSDNTALAPSGKTFSIGGTLLTVDASNNLVINPVGASSAMDRVALGITTPKNARVLTLGVQYLDNSASPGNFSSNVPSGIAAFAAGASTVVVTNTNVNTGSVILTTMQGADATLTSILRCVPGSGSFTVVGNANATAATKFAYLVLNA